MAALLTRGSGPGRGRRSQEAAGFGDGDVEPAAAVEAGPAGADAASSPVADGALRCADEGAELLEGEKSVVVPLGGDLDGLHGCLLRCAPGCLRPLQRRVRPIATVSIGIR